MTIWRYSVTCGCRHSASARHVSSSKWVASESLPLFLRMDLIRPDRSAQFAVSITRSSLSFMQFCEARAAYSSYVCTMPPHLRGRLVRGMPDAKPGRMLVRKPLGANAAMSDFWLWWPVLSRIVMIWLRTVLTDAPRALAITLAE